MIRKSMFNLSGAAPMQNALNFEFGAKEPDPLGTFRSRFNLSPDTTLEEDATTLKKQEPRKFRATEALMEYIASQPKREDYQLGKWGKVGAALTAAAAGFNNPTEGVRLGTELRDRPYTNAMQDYATKGSGLKLAADLESDLYGKDLDYQKMFHDWQDKAADNAREDVKVGLTRRGIENEESKWTDQQKQWREEFDLKKDEMKSKGWEEFVDKDGNTKLINTITKEERNLGPSIAASNLAVARVNAGANATRAGAAVTNAGAAVSNAATNQGRLTNEQKNTESLIKDRELNAIIDPRNELLVQAAAAKEVVADNPTFAQYVNEDGTINMEKLNNNRWFFDDEDEKSKFVEALKKKANEIRQRKKGASVNEGGVIELPPIPKPGGF